MSMSHAVRGVAPSLLVIVLVSVAAAGVEAAQPNGPLTVAYATLFDETLNPLFGAATSKAYFDVIYDYLIYNHPQTLKAEPGLAERWSLSNDGKRWVFFLRKGVTFSNGAELTAEDVKFSMELLVRKESRWAQRASFMRAEAKVIDRYQIAFDSRGDG